LFRIGHLCFRFGGGYFTLSVKQYPQITQNRMQNAEGRSQTAGGRRQTGESRRKGSTQGTQSFFQTIE
jgi:hypothetical protein